MGKQRIAGLLRQLRCDERGAIAAMLAVMFPVVLGIGALGIETGIWYTVKRHDQSVADVAAIAGATEIARGGTCTSGTGAGAASSCAAAAMIADTNGFDFTLGANSASEVVSPYSGPLCPGGTCVQAVLRHQQEPLLASLFIPDFTIANQAVARIRNHESCAFTFGENNQGNGIKMTGTTVFSQPNCEFSTNSPEPDSIQLNGNATLSLYSIYSAGGISTVGDSTNNLTLVMAPRTYQPPLDDPYASVEVATAPADLTTFAMPALPTSATSLPTTLPRPPAPPPGSNTFPVSLSPQTCSGTPSLDTVVTNISSTCYLGSPVELQGGTFNTGTYYFTGPVTVTGNVIVNGGVNIYVATGDFTVGATGTLTFAANLNSGTGSDGPAKVLVALGDFNAAPGTVAFIGDTSANSGYAITVGSAKAPKFGNASFGGGKYAFYGGALGGGLVLGGANATTSLGAANYYVERDGLSVAAGGTAAFSPDVANSAASKTTNLRLGNSGSVTSSGTLKFNETNTGGASYSFFAGSYTFAGTTIFGDASGDQKGYGFYGASAGVAITPTGGNTATLETVNFYVDAGNLAINGTTTFDATTSGDCTIIGNCTTITVNGGDVTSNAGGNLTFTGGVASQYNICTGGLTNQNACGSSNTKGVALSGPADFGTGLYYFMNNSNSATGVTLGSGASATFAPATYSIQKGNFTVASGAVATFSDAAGGDPTCAPAGNAGCLYLANGTFSNAGTASFDTGTYYIYAPTGTGTLNNANTGTLTLGASGTSTVFVNNPNSSFENRGMLNLGSGTHYFYNGVGGGSASGGLGNFGTMNLCGSSDSSGCAEAASNYYFINGKSRGTSGSSSGSCGNSSTVFGALSLMGGSTTDFGPGHYYAVNGDLCLNQSSGTAPLVNCTGCTLGDQGITFVLTGTGTGSTLESNISTLQIRGTIDTTAAPLYAPGDGPYQGLLIYQDRNAPLAQFSGQEGGCSVNCNQISGGATMDVTGAIYMPRAQLTSSSNNAVSSGGCLIIIADAVTLGGNSSLDIDGCADAGVSTVTSSTVTLVN